MGCRADVNTEIFENITLFGRPALFTCLRCDKNTLPQGVYMYEVRHDDDGQGDPCEIAEWILVNHWGTVISDEPIELNSGSGLPGGKPYRLIDSETDWTYEGTTTTLSEYLNRKKA